MVTRIDRLARSIGDLQDIVRAVRAKGGALKATEQPIDTRTAAGKAFLDNHQRHRKVSTRENTL
jgi:DNA invertase Pin-like site-specific DNA recombinase